MAAPNTRHNQVVHRDILTTLHHWVGVGKAGVMGVVFLWATISAWVDGRPATAMSAAIISLGLLLLAYGLYRPAVAVLWAALGCIGFGLVFIAGMFAADAEAGRERPPIKLHLGTGSNDARDGLMRPH